MSSFSLICISEIVFNNLVTRDILTKDGDLNLNLNKNLNENNADSDEGERTYHFHHIDKQWVNLKIKFIK